MVVIDTRNFVRYSGLFYKTWNTAVLNAFLKTPETLCFLWSLCDTKSTAVWMGLRHQKHCGINGCHMTPKTLWFSWSLCEFKNTAVWMGLRHQNHWSINSFLTRPETLRFSLCDTKNTAVWMGLQHRKHCGINGGHHYHHHQSLNREGRWGTTDDFATSFLHFPCSPLPSGACRTPGLSIPWCCLPTSSFVRLVFFHLSLSYDTRNIVVLTVVIRHQKPCASNAFFPWRFHKPFGSNGLLTIPEAFRFCWSPRDTNNIVVVMTFLRHERHLLDVTDLHASSSLSFP